MLISTGTKPISEAQPALTRFIRLTVYSYLSVGFVLKFISQLNSEERNSLRESVIAREGKRAIFDLKNLLSEDCLMHGANFDRVMQRIEFGLSLCDEAEFLCSRDQIAQCQEHGFDEALAFFLTSLPKRFNKKISMRLCQAKAKVNMKNFWLTLRARRPNFALRKLTIRGCHVTNKKLDEVSSASLMYRVADLDVQDI